METGTESTSGTLDPKVLLDVLTAFKRGDFSARMPTDYTGLAGKIADTLNEIIETEQQLSGEWARVGAAIRDGKLTARARFPKATGGWIDSLDAVNGAIDDVARPVNEMTRLVGAVAKGDFSQRMVVEIEGSPLKGELLATAKVVNGMVEQLGSFAAEVTRVAREVGTEGKLGGQAQVKGVGGVWNDLTDGVNRMASNLTAQVRDIAGVTTAVANGDLTRKITVDVRGEILELKNTVNRMVDQLNAFAGEVTRVAREVGVEGKLGGQANVPGVAGTWRDLTDNVNQLAGNLSSQVRAIGEVATAVAQGDLTRSVVVEAAGEMATLKDNINQMIRNLGETTRKYQDQAWLKTNVAELMRVLQGQRDLPTFAKSLLSKVAPLVQGHYGAFFLAEPEPSAKDGDPSLKLLAGYGYRERKGLSNRFKYGEGLVGQCALEKERILITNVPPDYVQVSSGLGEAPPLNLIVLPVVFEGDVKAVIEIGSFVRFTDVNLAFLEQLAESLGVVLNSIQASTRTEELLKQSQALTQELQAGQEELEETNEQLQSQARILRESEAKLKAQQRELRTANEELEERARLMAHQKGEVERRNAEMELARRQLQEKAEQLALTSKYKSEFLANMSHELRTPLNSMLILSKMLAESTEENLTPKQTEYAQTIHGAGSDLLALINDILDLSKIEAGVVMLEMAAVPFGEIGDFAVRSFGPVAEAKGLSFEIEIGDRLPHALRTDGRRLQQILKNLLSNAFKFTERGGVVLHMGLAAEGWSPDQEPLAEAESVVAFVVEDTGIGIPPEKQQLIFEAFQQADAGTTRKYGGTGLGLSISRELARLLGGEIKLESEQGQGSTFTLYLPLNSLPSRPKTVGGGPLLPARQRAARGRARKVEMAPQIPEPDDFAVADDREAIAEGDRVVLIIEDDAAFAQILLDLARERGFKGIVANRADRGLACARQYPITAVTLDLCLPDHDGWTVLDQLKHDPRTRHIPVHVISVEDAEARSLRLGAIAHLQKPASRESLQETFGRIESFIDRPIRRLLVVEDDDLQRRSIIELIGNQDVETVAVGTAKGALAALGEGRFDCMILDLRLPDMDGIELVGRIKDHLAITNLPIVVYTGKDLTRKEETELRRFAEAIVVKDVRSPERLLDETALFLHRVEANLSAPQRRLLSDLRRAEPLLAGKKVLVVDDDVRNIYALTSVLERHGMTALYVENGNDAIAFVKKTPDLDVVLMDVMMPEKDGYETTRDIRKMPGFKSLPIIALTAKAMKGDREKCIEAGASDYLAKPVDVDQLLSLLRVWVYR